MSGLQFAPDEYLVYVKMSKYRILLVEGPADQRFFQLLIDAILSSHLVRSNATALQLSEVKIDTAACISAADQMGNRDKVEYVCQKVNGRVYERRLLGFTDREFREFVIADPLEDRIRSHHVLGRSVWSRGHSIENYFFDFASLREPLRDFSVTEHFGDALALLEKIYEHTVRTACAITLAARDNNLLTAAPHSFDWKCIDLSSSMVNIDPVVWKERLVNRQHVDAARADGMIASYQSWYEIVSRADMTVVRWLCHGHIGLALMWAVYGKCVYEVCSIRACPNPDQEVIRVLKAEESVRFNSCAASWTRHALGERSDSPLACLQMLMDNPAEQIVI